MSAKTEKVAVATPGSEGRFLTLNDIADRLAVSRRLLERWLSSGRFPRADIRIGRCMRWRPEAFAAWVESQTARN